MPVLVQTYADISFMLTIVTMKSYSKICSLPMDMIVLT